MRLIKFSTLAFFIFAYCGMLYGPAVKTVTLNQDTDNYVTPMNLTVYPGESVKFVSTSGDFDVTIPNAGNLFVGVIGSLTIHLNSSHPESQTYTVRSVDSPITQEYSVYCVTTGGSTEAPPRIIITPGSSH